MLMEHGEAIRIGPARGRWSLVTAARRAALAELSREGKIQEALEANPGPLRSDNPTQRALDRLLREQKLTLSGTTLSDLLGLERAIDLASPALSKVDVPALRSQVMARLERLRLLEPLQRLVAHGFAGREKELRELRRYVDELPSKSFWEAVSRRLDNVVELFCHRPALVITGPGGVGKSTLLARFLLDHASPDKPRPTPFVYLDFDRGQIDPTQPDTLLAEAFMQIAAQFPELAERARHLSQQARTRISSEDMRNVARSSHFDRSKALRNGFIELMRSISRAKSSNVLLFVDTFEVVQRRGPTATYNVLSLAAELLSDMPSLRFVIAGRAPLLASDFNFATTTPPWRSIHLAGFDDASGRAYLKERLKKRGVPTIPASTASRIVSLVQGNPLSLRLAADVFSKQGMEGVQDAVQKVIQDARLQVRFTNELVQGMLHSRIVQSLAEPVRQIADPGLVVRRITRDVIAEVLAGPCKIDLGSAGGVDALYRALQDEVALVESAGEGVLRHRSDVRQIMLPLLREKLGKKAREIDEAAVAFWRRKEDPDARAEVIYHLIWLGADRADLEEQWERGSVAEAPLAEALDELDALETAAMPRIWLCEKLQRDLTPELEKEADLVSWERSTELRVRSLLASGAAEEALSALRRRRARSPASPLWSIEVEALMLIGKGPEALRVVDRATTAASRARAHAQVARFQVQKALLLERVDRLEEAWDCIRPALELARELGDEAIEVEAQVAHVRLARKLRKAEVLDAQQRLVLLLGRPAAKEALDRSPALLSEAGAEIGDQRPDLFIDSISRQGTEDSDLRVEVSNLIGMGVAYGRRGKTSGAILALQEALNIARRIDDRSLIGRALLHLGRLHLDANQASDAKGLLEESLEIAKLIADHTLELRALGGLGSLYASSGRYDEAIRFYEESLHLARAVGDDGSEGNALANLAHVHGARGDWRKAIELLRRDLAISERVVDRHGHRQAMTNLATAHWHLGEAEPAKALYSQSLEIARELDDRPGMCAILVNLGALTAHSGDAVAAERFFEDALQMSEEMQNLEAQTVILGNLGILRRQRGDLESARMLHSRQLALNRRRDHRVGEAEALRQLALDLGASGDLEAAKQTANEAFELLQSLGPVGAEMLQRWQVKGQEDFGFVQEWKWDDLDALREFRGTLRMSVEGQIRQDLREPPTNMA